MSWIDWMIVVIPLAIVAVVAFRTQKHVANITTVWFVYGGIHDLRELFRNMKTLNPTLKTTAQLRLPKNRCYLTTTSISSRSSMKMRNSRSHIEVNHQK